MPEQAVAVAKAITEIFRDQQVLFANRALTDLLGHEGVESLRAAGIANPADSGGDSDPAGSPICGRHG